METYVFMKSVIIQILRDSWPFGIRILFLIIWHLQTGARGNHLNFFTSSKIIVQKDKCKQQRGWLIVPVRSVLPSQENKKKSTSPNWNPFFNYYYFSAWSDVTKGDLYTVSMATSSYDAVTRAWSDFPAVVTAALWTFAPFSPLMPSLIRFSRTASLLSFVGVAFHFLSLSTTSITS